jgi:hypothetical protein
MKRGKGKKKGAPKRVLRLPDLDCANQAVLNTLGSPASKRAYQFAIDDLVPGTAPSRGSPSAEPSYCDTGWNSKPGGSPQQP